MAEKRSISVRIRGREFRLRGDEDEESLQRVAKHLEETMSRLEARMGVVDSLDVALLTALNLARDVLALREGRRGEVANPRRLRSLIELAESALPAP